MRVEQLLPHDSVPNSCGTGYDEISVVLSWQVFALMLESVICKRRAGTKHLTRLAAPAIN